MLLLLSSTFYNCGPATQCTGALSSLTIDPNKGRCELDCECNNKRYTGYCNEGVCESKERGSCTTPGEVQPCILPDYAVQGSCKQGRRFCQPPGIDSLKWGDCVAFTPTANEQKVDLCGDGIDNDCDGKVDKADPDCAKFCDPGKTATCFDGPKDAQNEGLCKMGRKICQENGEWGKCEYQVLPKKEVCNGKDDDCDGGIDNVKGKLKEKLPSCRCWPPGLLEVCYTGPEATKGKGRCRAGSRTCTSAGTWGACTGEVLPAKKESCNLLDDDCDGVIDRENGKRISRPCYSEIVGCQRGDDGKFKCASPCRTGTQTCINGNWSTCKNEKTPVEEKCNGLDDDCDGQVDNALTDNPFCQKQKGRCAMLKAPSSRCVQGKWTKCTEADYKGYFSEYSTAEQCDSVDNNCNGQVDENVAQCVSHFAGQADGFKDGPGPEALFRKPTSLVAYKHSVFIADTGNFRIRKMDPCGNVSTFVGSGNSGNKAGKGTLAEFGEIKHMTVDSSGNLYAGDGTSRVILKITPDGSVSRYIGTGQDANSNGPLQLASFSRFDGLAVTPDSKKLYVATNNILRVVFEGKVSECFFAAGPCAAKLKVRPKIEDNITALVYDASRKLLYIATSSQLFAVNPSALTTKVLAGKGTLLTFKGLKTLALEPSFKKLYVGDADKFYEFDLTTDKIRPLIGSGSGPLTGAFGKVRVNTPTSFTVNTAGSLFYTSASSATVHKAQVLALPPDAPKRCGFPVAGAGTAGFKNGSFGQAQFASLSSIHHDALGNLYVADKKNHQVRKLSFLGTVTTYAGSSGQGFKDGPAQLALFKEPSSAFVGKNQEIFVADSGNHAIRRIVQVNKQPCGSLPAYTGLCVYTIAGSGSPGKTDGAGLSAQFQHPSHLALNAQNELFVSDSGNKSLRKISYVSKGDCNGKKGFTGYCVTTFLKAGTQKAADGPIATATTLGTKALLVQPNGELFFVEGDASIRRVFKAKSETCGTQKSYSGWCVSTILKAEELQGPGTALVKVLHALHMDEKGQLLLSGTIGKSGVIYTLTNTPKTTPGGCLRPANASGYCAKAWVGGAKLKGQVFFPVEFNPTSLTLTASGDLYLTDVLQERVYRIPAE